MYESEKWKWSRSVVPDSQLPHGLQPTRLLHPWDFPGKSTGVGCHCLLQWMLCTIYVKNASVFKKWDTYYSEVIKSYHMNLWGNPNCVSLRNVSKLSVTMGSTILTPSVPYSLPPTHPGAILYTWECVLSKAPKHTHLGPHYHCVPSTSFSKLHSSPHQKFQSQGSYFNYFNLF